MFEHTQQEHDTIMLTSKYGLSDNYTNGLYNSTALRLNCEISIDNVNLDVSRNATRLYALILTDISQYIFAKMRSRR